MLSETSEKQRANRGYLRDKKGKFIKGNPTAFQPGESGNPAGRPKGIMWNDFIEDLHNPEKKWKGPGGILLTSREYTKYLRWKHMSKSPDFFKKTEDRESPPESDPTQQGNTMTPEQVQKVMSEWARSNGQ